MWVKLTPAECRDLNAVARLTGDLIPRFPETDAPAFVPLTATEASDLRDDIARSLLWVTDLAETARLCALASDLYRYSETARQVETRTGALELVAV